MLLVRRTRAGSTAACEESRKKQGEICVFHVRFHGRPEKQKSLRYLRAKVIIIAIFSSDIVPIFVAVAVIRCFETGVCETACGRTDSVFSGCGVPVRAGGLHPGVRSHCEPASCAAKLFVVRRNVSGRSAEEISGDDCSGDASGEESFDRR